MPLPTTPGNPKFIAPLPVWVKRLLIRWAGRPWINPWLVRAFTLLKPLTPPHLLHRIPVTGEVWIPLPGGRRVGVCSDGEDQIAAMLHWGGWEGFEGETFRVFEALLPHVGVVLDLGANTGWYALAAGTADPARRVYAFEPVPAIFQRLTANIRLNGLTNVTAVAAAAAEREGEGVILLPDGSFLPTSATLEPDHLRAIHRRIRAETPIPLTTVDAFLAQREGESEGAAANELPMLIKIDVEGAEPRVLRGALRTLDRRAPLLVCEVLPGAGAAIAEALAGRDYLFYHLRPEGAVERRALVGDPAMHWLNWLLVPRRRREETRRALAAAGIPMDPAAEYSYSI
ncbi:MAG: FkbM family methyltransferase [Magnetococcales bacterium]|nr:FkbM family methyltransferase [Magnetococcales bacterium]